ncbi:hypothetical protein IAU59_005144 [Kwoniella sp. CBS 9459]
MSAVTTTAAIVQAPTPPIQQQGPVTSLISNREILERIFYMVLNTDRKALTACARASKHFHSVAAPVLYSRIRLSAVPPHDSRREGPNADHIANLSSISLADWNPVTSDRKKALLKHAKIVSVDPHCINVCKHRTPTDVKTGSREGDKNQKSGGHDDTTAAPAEAGATDRPNDIYSLNLPKTTTLVISPLMKTYPEAGPFYHMEYEAQGFSSQAHESCGFISSLVHPDHQNCPCPGLKKIVLDSTYDSTFPSLPKLNELVFIFHTEDPSVKWKMGTHNIFGWAGIHYFSSDLFSLAQLLWHLEDPTTPVYIVNAGSLYHTHVGLKKGATVEMIQEAFLKDLFSSLSSKTYKQELDFPPSRYSLMNAEQKAEADRAERQEISALNGIGLSRAEKASRISAIRIAKHGDSWKTEDTPEGRQREKDEMERLEIKMKHIHLLTMKEYLANHDWEGEFEPEEVVKWRETEDAAPIALGDLGRRSREQAAYGAGVGFEEAGQPSDGPSSSKRYVHPLSYLTTPTS